MVTDYSSIGADFSFWRNVIYAYQIFGIFKENGESFFFNNGIIGKFLAYKEDELIIKINNTNNFDPV